MKVFGKASDFYRLRVLKVSEDSEPTLEWPVDVLLRQPPAHEPETTICYLLQAVSMDDESVFLLKRFADGEMAMRFRDKVDEFLRELTKHEFEEKFPAADFRAAPAGNGPAASA